MSGGKPGSGAEVPRVPRLTRALLSAALHPADRAFVLADLEEEFEELRAGAGARTAARWYRTQARRSLLPALRGRLVRRSTGVDGRGRREGTMRGAVQNLVSDLAIAVRRLLRAPLVLVVTVVSLGVGIGATTTVFGVANSLLLRGTAGISDPETLVVVYTTEDDGDAYGSTSYPDYLDLLAGVGALRDAAAVGLRTVAAGEGERIEPLLAEEVTGNYFSVTGLRPVLGRALLPADAEAGSGERVAVVGHTLWQRTFGGRPEVLGATLRLNGYPHTVVGVAPRGVLSRRAPLEPDVWIPLGSLNQGAVPPSVSGNRDVRDLLVVGRLAEGATKEALAGQLAVLSARLGAEYPSEWRDHLGNPRALSLLGEKDSRLRPGARAVVGGVAAFFLGAAGLILLIACANVTTLFLARASARSREMAVRLSLGAGRRRLVSMFLTEGLVIGLLGGAVGLLLTSWLNRVMGTAVASLPFGLPIRVAFGVDGRVVAVAVGLSLAASLVFGITPALEGSRPDLVRALKGLGHGGSRGLRSQKSLVVVQCAASVVLLVGAALFIRSLGNAAQVDLGLEPDRIAVATKKLDAEGYGAEEGWQYIRDLQARLGAGPDVDAVHASRSMELTLMSINPTLEVEVEEAGEATGRRESQRFWRNSVTPGYLQMLGIRVVRGRALEDGDVEGAPRVAVVNEEFARRLWPGQDPLGRTFHAVAKAPAGALGEATDTRAFQVVGVTETGRYFDFDDAPTPYYWTSLFQDYAARVVVSVRGTVGVEPMVPLLRENVLLATGEVQLSPPAPLAHQLSFQFVHLRIASRVLRWGGAFGLFLAFIGIYGIVSFSVTRRTREMAIRMAVGAERRQVLRGVLRDGLRPALLGLAVGTALAFAGASLTRSVLVGVGPMDPLAFVGGTSVLLAAALLASFIPARRTLGIDPMETLRDE